MHAGTSCEAFTWLRSKISWDISDRLVVRSEIVDTDRAESSERRLVGAAGRFKSFFSLSLERERSAGETAHRCRYTGTSVFDRRQKFCESAARLDGLAKLSSRSNGVEGQIEPELKCCGPTMVRVLMHKCISHMLPSSELNINKLRLGSHSASPDMFLHHCLWSVKLVQLDCEYVREREVNFGLFFSGDETARAGIEPTTAAPSQPDRPGVSRQDQSAFTSLCRTSLLISLRCPFSCHSPLFLAAGSSWRALLLISFLSFSLFPTSKSTMSV